MIVYKINYVYQNRTTIRFCYFIPGSQGQHTGERGLLMPIALLLKIGKLWKQACLPLNRGAKSASPQLFLHLTQPLNILWVEPTHL